MIHRWYTLWAPFYDAAVGPFLDAFRRRAVAALELAPGQRLLISGIGTGLDIPLLPRGIEIVGCDLNESMLERARGRAAALSLRARLELADAQALPYPDASFDRAYLPLIVCIAPQGNRVLSEALRAVKPGGRIVVIDKFLGEDERPSAARRLADAVSRRIVTSVNRRWSEISAGVSGFAVIKEEPGPLGGFFRLYVLRKS